MHINALELIAFIILFFVFKKVTKIKPGKLLALAGLFPFFLPFTQLSNPTAANFLSRYLSLLAHFFVHVGIGSVVGITLEEFS